MGVFFFIVGFNLFSVGEFIVSISKVLLFYLVIVVVEWKLGVKFVGFFICIGCFFFGVWGKNICWIVFDFFVLFFCCFVLKLRFI